MKMLRTLAAIVVSLITLTALLTSCAPRGENPVEGVTTPGVTTIKMVDARKGWALKGGTVLRTTDGGRTWKDVSPKEDRYPEGAGAAFLDSDHAWLAVTVPQPDQMRGTLRIYRTADGGSTWESSDIAEPAVVGKLTFLNANDGWAVLHQGIAMMHEQVAVFGTTDGGKTWSPFSATSLEGEEGSLPLTGDKSGLSFATKDKGFVTGYWPIPGSPYLFSTVDGGRTWSQTDLPIPAGSEGAHFFTYPPVFSSENEGVLPVSIRDAEQNFIFYSTKNGGETWQPGSPISFESSNLTWDSPSAGLIVVATGEGLQVSRDAGKSWSKVSPSIDLGEDTVMSFISETTGWVLSQGNFYRTTDGGKTWKRV